MEDGGVHHSFFGKGFYFFDGAGGTAFEGYAVDLRGGY